MLHVIHDLGRMCSQNLYSVLRIFRRKFYIVIPYVFELLNRQLLLFATGQKNKGNEEAGVLIGEGRELA